MRGDGEWEPDRGSCSFAVLGPCIHADVVHTCDSLPAQQLKGKPLVSAPPLALPSRMTTYRSEIRNLDRLATPAPWVAEGELYGIAEKSSFMPLGFAPPRPLDSRLIVVYRSAVMQLIEAVDAVERLAMRARDDASAPAAIGIRQVLAILDGRDGDTNVFRRTLADLDRRTTPPLWDPGHLVLGMELGPEVQSMGIATPRGGDPSLIAAARIAVPRALELLRVVEGNVADHGLRDGRLRGEGALAIAAAVTAFDEHSAGEGSGTGTV